MAPFAQSSGRLSTEAAKLTASTKGTRAWSRAATLYDKRNGKTFGVGSQKEGL